MSLNEEEEARRAYMLGASRKMVVAMVDGDVAAAVEVVNQMGRDGYDREARVLIRFLVDVALDAGTSRPGLLSAPPVKVVVAHTQADLEDMLSGAMRAAKPGEAGWSNCGDPACRFCPPETATEPGA